MPDTLTPEMREGLPEPEGYRVNSLPDENDIVFGKGPITCLLYTSDAADE